MNTISWNKSGTLIVSGSDDLDIKIFQAFPKKLVDSYTTDHTANIFSAKFMHEDCKIVSCSAAGVVKYHDLESRVSTSYACHGALTYEVVVDPGSLFKFMCCSEDGDY